MILTKPQVNLSKEKEILCAGSPRCEPMIMDYPKNSGFPSGPGISLIHGHTKLPLPFIMKTLTKIGAQITFNRISMEVNHRVTDIHSTMPNPYSLLSSPPPTRAWYTVLDLKDAFFSLFLAIRSQSMFAFEWHDPIHDTMIHA